MEKATQFRSLFDKAKGDYASLSPTDHATFVGLCGGDEAKAEQTWNVMKFGPGASASTSSKSGGG